MTDDTVAQMEDGESQPGWPGIITLNDVTPREAALAYAAAGIPIFPVFGLITLEDGTWGCACDSPGCGNVAKHPLVKWTREATTDRDTVDDWYLRWPSANVAMPTGAASGFIVVDLDQREMVNQTTGEIEHIDGSVELANILENLDTPWPLTLEQRTGGGGTQLVMQNPTGVKTIASWLPGVDIRGDGGYVVLPSSRHRSGSSYAWTNEHAPSACPPRLTAALQVARGHRTTGAGGTSTATTHHGYDYTRAKVEGPPVGARDDFFNAYAFEMRSAGVDYQVAIAKLREVWEKTPQPQGESFFWETVVEKANRVWETVAVDEERVGHDVALQQWAQRLTASVATEPTLIPADSAAPAQPSVGGPPGAGLPPTGVGGDGTVPRRQMIIEGGDQRELLTDLGNSQRFARLLADQVRHVHGIGWFIWSGTHWKQDDTDQIHDLTRVVLQDIRREANEVRGVDGDRLAQHAIKSESLQRRKAIVQGASFERPLSLTLHDLDKPRNLLNVLNGTLDLDTLTLQAHNPDDIMTKCCTVPWMPEITTSPLLDEFIKTFIPDPADVDYLFRALGAALYAGNPMRNMLIMIGGTTSGKSTLVDGIMMTLGSYAVPINSSVLRGTLDDKPRPDLIRALPARFAIAHEASPTWEVHTDQVKRLTGGDPIVARTLYSAIMVERIPNFTPLIVTNEMPHVRGADQAIRRRLLALPLTHSLQPWEVDPNKKPEFIADEQTRIAILSRLVVGCWQMRQMKSLGEAPQSFEIMTMRAFNDMDDVAEFLEWLIEADRLVSIDPSNSSTAYFVTTAELHSEYIRWLKEHGSADQWRARLGVKNFSFRLEAFGWNRIRSNGTRWQGKHLRSLISLPPAQ